MTTRLMSREELNKLLVELMRRPQTREVLDAIAKVRQNIKDAK